MKYIENIVIGKPLVQPSSLFAIDDTDWNTNEKDKTLFTEERNLAKILVEIGVFPSISEIRRNKPELMVTLNEVDFINKLKVRKKQYMWIAVGE